MPCVIFFVGDYGLPVPVGETRASISDARYDQVCLRNFVSLHRLKCARAASQPQKLIAVNNRAMLEIEFRSACVNARADTSQGFIQTRLRHEIILRSSRKLRNCVVVKHLPLIISTSGEQAK